MSNFATTENLGGSASIFSTLTKFFKKEKFLPQPNSYINLNREFKSVFVNDRQKFDGVNISVVRPLTNMVKKFPSVFFVHNFSIGQAVVPTQPAPDNYQFQCQYLDKKGRLIGVWSPKQLITKLSRKWDLKNKEEKNSGSFLGELIYERMKARVSMHNFVARANYKNRGSGYCMEGKFKSSGEYSASFTQSVTQALTLGSMFVHNVKKRKSDISFAARMVQFKVDEFGLKTSKKPNMECVTELKLKDMGTKTVKILKASYYKQIEQNTKMGTEIEWDISNRDAKLKYGFEQTYLSGARVRVNVDNELNLVTAFDFHITPKTLASVLTQAKPIKNEYKFGLNLQFQ